MSGWPTNRIEAHAKISVLEDVAHTFNGKTPSKGEQRSDGHPVLKIKDVDEFGDFKGTFESFVDPAFADTFAAKQVLDGDTLILNAAHNADYVGSKTYRAQAQTFGALATGEWLIVRPDPQKLHAGFAHHWINDPGTKRAIKDLVKGIHLYPKDVARLKIYLPALSEQRRIADILDKADALRAKRRAALAQLDTLAQSIFLDMFGDPITNPKKWRQVPFEKICDRVTVGIVVQPASYYVASGVPALRSLNIKPGRIHLQDLVYFSESDNETKLAKTRLKEGDLVLVRSGQPGTAAVVPHELDGVNAIDLLIATPLRKLANPIFLCEFFNSGGGRDLVLSRQRGQVQKHLNVGSLNQAVLPLPPIELQREYACRIDAIEALSRRQNEALAELNKLFVSLQHRAFRGELTSSAASKAA